jgi:NADPH:quinone reductase
MKAVRIHEYGGPQVLRYEETDRPQPQAGQLLVRVQAAAVNVFDVTMREGRFKGPLPLPKTIGSDGAGVVEQAGYDVEGVSTGDEIMFTGLGISLQGSYAEYAIVLPVQAVPKPAGLTFAEAAAMGVVFPTALYALTRRADLQEGETVLVQGAAGGVGGAAVQLAKAFGARVIGTVLEEEHVQRVRELGADEVVLWGQPPSVERIKELTEGRGVDVIVEIAAADNLATDLGLIARGGRVAVVGSGSAAEAEIPYGAASGVDASLLYLASNNAGRAGMAQMLREVGEMVGRGEVRPVVGEVLPLIEARRAHEQLSGLHFGKIVLVP